MQRLKQLRASIAASTCLVAVATLAASAVLAADAPAPLRLMIPNIKAEKLKPPPPAPVGLDAAFSAGCMVGTLSQQEAKAEQAVLDFPMVATGAYSGIPEYQGAWSQWMTAHTPSLKFSMTDIKTAARSLRDETTLPWLKQQAVQLAAAEEAQQEVAKAAAVVAKAPKRDAKEEQPSVFGMLSSLWERRDEVVPSVQHVAADPAPSAKKESKTASKDNKAAPVPAKLQVGLVVHSAPVSTPEAKPSNAPRKPQANLAKSLSVQTHQAVPVDEVASTELAQASANPVLLASLTPAAGGGSADMSNVPLIELPDMTSPDLPPVRRPEPKPEPKAEAAPAPMPTLSLPVPAEPAPEPVKEPEAPLALPTPIPPPAPTPAEALAMPSEVVVSIPEATTPPTPAPTPAVDAAKKDDAISKLPDDISAALSEPKTISNAPLALPPVEYTVDNAQLEARAAKAAKAKKAVKKAAKAAEEDIVPTPAFGLPQQNVLSLPSGAAADASAEGTDEPTLSPDSRKLLGKVKPPAEKKRAVSKEPVDIARTRDMQDLFKGADEQMPLSQHEAMGIKIEMKRPKLNVDYELDKAYNAVSAGQTESAIVLYKRVLSVDPNNTNALFGLATLYHRARQFDDARPLYARLLSVDPKHRDGFNNFLVLLADEAPNEALVELEKLESRNPGFSPIPAQIAVIYQKTGNLDRATEKMLRAVALSPENLTYRYNLAIMMDKQKKYDEAARLYGQLLEAASRGEKIPGNTSDIQQRLTFIRSNNP
jgi:tetratricopeptide (TPR) repeat protein